MHRRSLLKAVGLGGLAGMSATGGAVTASGESSQPRSFVLCSPYLRSSAPPTSVPEVGSTSVIEGLLCSEAGAAIGRFHASRVVIQSGSAVEVEYFDQHMFHLEDGTLLGSGHATRTRHIGDEFAVSGGLGAFLHTSGSYRMYWDGTDSGGDGSVRFEIALNGGSQWR